MLVPDCTLEEDGILWDDRNGGPEVSQPQLADGQVVFNGKREM
jgi:hypothetical protein